jgi:hypothetical protein
MMFRTLSERTTVTQRQSVGLAVGGGQWRVVPTFILSYVLERKRETRVLALDDAHLAKRALSDDTQQAEVVEIDWQKSVKTWQAETLGLRRTLVGEDDRLPVALTHGNECSLL